jgi:hypothetical protein
MLTDARDQQTPDRLRNAFMKNGLMVLLIALAVSGTHCATYLLDNPVRGKADSLQLTIEKIKTGPDTINKGNYTFYPNDPVNGLLWMEVTVANTGAVPVEVDLRRVRLVADLYVSDPKFVVSGSGIPREAGTYTIKPQEQLTRWLVYVYTRGRHPYRVVYDSLLNGRIADTIKIDLTTRAE